MGNVIECPKHNGRFDIPTGAAKRAPVCEDLKTYPVKIEANKVLIHI
jgi:3-phenylpropionate/trans-cinnamate dioxygenase ferredoxin subunit